MSRAHESYPYPFPIHGAGGRHLPKVMLADVADALRALRFVGMGWNQEGVLNPLSGGQGLDSAPNVNDKR